MPTPQAKNLRRLPLNLLVCPLSGTALRPTDGRLVSADGHAYALTPEGVPLFAAEFCSPDARAQETHFDAVAAAYVANLDYAHTQEYMAFLDRALLDRVGAKPLGTTAEICCGRGEAFALMGERMDRGVGVDISAPMLKAALSLHDRPHLSFIQGDATRLPLADAAFDTVFMLGGIHHVNDRAALFREIARILKPGGMFYFREPVSDFFLWRWLRGIIYRLSPALDHATERPLLWKETIPPLESASLRCRSWTTHGLLGCCIFMNSDVLVFNRCFRYIPGIRALTRLAARLDERMIALPGLGRRGLMVICSAQKVEPGSSGAGPA